VGYPLKPELLDEEARALRFIDALNRGRNTYWNRMVRTAVEELFGITLTDAKSIFEINRKISLTRDDPQWAEKVCLKAGIAKLTITPAYKRNGLELIRHRHAYYNFFSPVSNADVDIVSNSADQKAAAEKLIAEKRRELKSISDAGISVLRTEWPFDAAQGLATDYPELQATGNSRRAIRQSVGHAIFRTLDEMNFHLQIFIGMSAFPDEMISGAHGHCALNDPRRLFDMSGIFDRYSACTFEILNAAELSSLDIVQMARIFCNVVPGGLWWFSFRGSVYQSNFQYRFEALPACRSTIIATDARCMEWAYIKTRFVKRQLAQFLCRQIEEGYADHETAMYAAKSWLHDTAANYYVKNK
jgi:glucuronate isomerase